VSGSESLRATAPGCLNDENSRGKVQNVWRDSSGRRLRRRPGLRRDRARVRRVRVAANDNYFQLSDLVDAALNESKWTLSRNAKKYLPKLRDVGHQSAHGRYYHARRDDILAVKPGCRVVIEEFLHHAKLL